MQTSSELQDIHKSVSLLESCAHALCLVPSFVLCMDFYWNSSVRTKTAGAAEVIYKKMCMLLTSHREWEREMKWTMRWSAPQTESLTSSRRRQTRTLKKCWKFYSYSCGSAPHTHTHTHPLEMCIYICSMQTVNTQTDTNTHTHTQSHTWLHDKIVHTRFLPAAVCRRRREHPAQPDLVLHGPAPSCPASPKVHVIGLTNAICLGSRDWSRQRNVIICAHNYICLYCMHKRTNRPRIDGVSHLEPTQLRRCHVGIGSLHTQEHTHRHRQTDTDRDRHLLPVRAQRRFQ